MLPEDRARATRLAEELWQQIPAQACPEITLPTPLVLKILRLLRDLERAL